MKKEAEVCDRPTDEQAEKIKVLPVIKPHKRKMPTLRTGLFVSGAIAIVLCIVLSFTTCLFGHDWQDATCTEPISCAKCGKTDGEARGHEWIAATYDTPKTCKLCGAVEGRPLSIIDIVVDAYLASIAKAKSLGMEASYSYGVLHEEIADLQDELKHKKISETIFASIFADTESIAEARNIIEDSLDYILSEDEDMLSALMRKFTTLSSVAGKIQPQKVSIVVEDIDLLLAELHLKPETLGKVLAMLSIYDYTWLSNNADPLLKFSDSGFTFSWQSFGSYELKL